MTNSYSVIWNKSKLLTELGLSILKRFLREIDAAAAMKSIVSLCELKTKQIQNYNSNL
jgi:hypothetical protein